MELRLIADKVAKGVSEAAERGIVRRIHRADFEYLRDQADTATQGELDAFQLDMLTEMIARRLEQSAN